MALRPATTAATLSLLAVVVLAVVVHLRALPGAYVYDDHRIRDSADVRGEAPLGDVFRHNFWGDVLYPGPGEQWPRHHSYRPVVILVWRAWGSVFGLEAASMRSLNLVLHAANSALVLVLMRQATLLALTTPARASERTRQLVALSAALLFAVHPIQTEAVASIVGAAELLSAAFLLLGLTAFLALREPTPARGDTRTPAAPEATADVRKEPRPGSVDATEPRPATPTPVYNRLGATACAVAGACGLLSLFSKETGIMTLPLCALADWVLVARFEGVQLTGRGRVVYLRRHAGFLGRLGVLAVATLCQAALRLWVDSRDEHLADLLSNPSKRMVDPAARLLSKLHFSVYHAALLCWPSPQAMDYSGFSIRLIESVWDPRNLGTLALLALVVGLALRSALGVGAAAGGGLGRLACFAGCFAVVAFLPCTHLGPAVAYVIAERLLYLPSVSAALALACLLVSLGARLASGRAPRQGRAAAALLVVLALQGMAVATVRQTWVWRSEYSVATASAEAVPGNPKMQRNRVPAIFGRPDLRDLQEDMLIKSLAAAPFYTDAANILSMLYTQRVRRHAVIDLTLQTEQALAAGVPGLLPLRNVQIQTLLSNCAAAFFLGGDPARAASVLESARRALRPEPPGANATLAHLRRLEANPALLRTEQLLHGTFSVGEPS